MNIDSEQLKVHLETLSANFKRKIKTVNIFDMKDFVLNLSPNERLIFQK